MHARMPVAAPMPAPAPIMAAPPAAPDDLASRLAMFVSSPGVRFAALVDREGFLIESAGETALEADVAGVLAPRPAGGFQWTAPAPRATDRLLPSLRYSS